MKKILVVDDSALMRKIICDIINTRDGYIIDECADGQTAFDMIIKGDYDAVLLDMVLPKVSGINLLGRLQKEENHTPIVAMSSTVKEDAETALMAAERGALDFLVKPFRVTSESKDPFEKRIFEVLDLAISSKGRVRLSSPQAKTAPVAIETVAKPSKSGKKKLIALASSTGGPQALHEVIPLLPAELGVPMVLVQHMPAGFTESLAARLDSKSKVTVKEASDGDVLQNNTVYIAPGGKHMEIKVDKSGKHFAHVYDGPPVSNLRPCADVMYESIKSSTYDEIVCVVLTGMGQDGTKGIKSLKQAKDCYVITQNEETCVVYGMPKAAYQNGLSNESVALGKVADSIVRELGV